MTDETKVMQTKDGEQIMFLASCWMDLTVEG